MSIPHEPAGGGRRRVVALTGASRGIGLATARVLCAAGYTVVAGARDTHPLEAAGLGVRLRAVRVDLTDGTAIERFAAAVGRAVAGTGQHGAGGAAEEAADGAPGSPARRSGGAPHRGTDRAAAGRKPRIAAADAAGGTAEASEDGAATGAAPGAAGAPDRGTDGAPAGAAARTAVRDTGTAGAPEGHAGTGAGRLVALINNAGVGALGAGEEFPLERARAVMETNLWGAARLAQLLLPLLRAGAAPGRPACLLNVGSLIAEYPVPFHALYAASKGALRAYTLALRGELAGHGVAVVLLEPGDVATGTTPLQHAAAESPYAAAFARVSAARAAKMAAAPRPAAVARRVLRVLGQRRPPPIVACGGAAPLLRLVRRLLPDRLAEYVTLRAYALRPGNRARPDRKR